MQIDAVENALFSVTVDSLLKFLISRFDRECLTPKLFTGLSGTLVSLCPTCQHIGEKMGF